jgi:hypothetical protein
MVLKPEPLDKAVLIRQQSNPLINLNFDAQTPS